MKNKIKILLIMLGLTMPFMTNNVLAEELTTNPDNKTTAEENKEKSYTFEEIDKILADLKTQIPDEMTLDIKESEALEFDSDYNTEKSLKLVYDNIQKIFADNDITLPLTIKDENGNATISEIYTYFAEPIHKVELRLSASCYNTKANVCNNIQGSLNKIIEVSYSNSKDYDANIAAEITQKLESLTYEINYKDFGADSPITDEGIARNVKTKLNDDSLDVRVSRVLGSPDIDRESWGFNVDIYKNDVYYGSTLYYSYTVGRLTIPANISDDDLEDYAINKIKEILGNSADYKEQASLVTGLKKINSLGGINGEEDERLISDFYLIEGTGFAVQLKKESTIINTTNANVTLNEETISEESEVYTELQDKIDKSVYTDIVGAFEITTQDNIDGKLSLTFNIGEAHNMREALILHKKHNGEIEEFKSVVKDGVVTIEVDELSPFMIALGDVVKTDGNNPITGTINVIFYTMIAMASLGGMIYLIANKDKKEE